MTDRPVPGNGLADIAHRMLDRLTAMKLRVGSLRLRMRLGAIAPADVETHLIQIEKEIDDAATLAHDVQEAEGAGPR